MNIYRGLAAVLAVAITGGASAAYGQEKITIGFATAQSGWNEAYDEPAARGAIIRINELNAKGGLLGKQINIVRRDTKTDRAEGVKVGQDLLDQGVDMLVVTGDYNLGAPIALKAEKAGIISFLMQAEDTKAGLIGPYSFSFAASNAVAISATVGAWAYKKLDVRKPYMLLDPTIDYNKATCQGFDYIFGQSEGVKVVGSDTFKNDDPSIASQISRIKDLAEQPDAIALCSVTPGAATAIRQLRAAGIDLPILSGEALDGLYWLDSVPEVSKVYSGVQGSVRGDDPRPEVNALSASFKKTFGVAPDQQSAITGYIMIDLWARAVEQVGATDSAKVKDVLESFNEVQTIASPRTFTPKLHITNRPKMLIEEAKGDKQVILGEWALDKDVPLDVLLGK